VCNRGVDREGREKWSSPANGQRDELIVWAAHTWHRHPQADSTSTSASASAASSSSSFSKEAILANITEIDGQVKSKRRFFLNAEWNGWMETLGNFPKCQLLFFFCLPACLSLQQETEWESERERESLQLQPQVASGEWRVESGGYANAVANALGLLWCARARSQQSVRLSVCPAVQV